MSEKNPVRKLNVETARKIAAGEVIDRPNAVVRELLDNAIDSGATSITVELVSGGIEKIRVVDNGTGMTRKDLETCAHPHCTSKISNETDLLNLSTLGFRGEALASIAAVARLSIITGGFKMRASITEDHIIEPFAQTSGTIVQSEGLFENFPARRQFLKRPASEGVMCKSMFIEKSLPRPDIAFRLVMDGETKIDLQKVESLTSRFVRATGLRENERLFYEIKGAGDGWSFRAIVGEPSVNRTNKKDISIFVNGRKIQEYSLVQAVEYGGQGFFPNGTYPVAAVFIQMDPKLVDFNIHPAKKEARFADISSLHHGISSTVRNFYKNYTIQNLAANALDETSPRSLTSARSLADSPHSLSSVQSITSPNSLVDIQNPDVPRSLADSRPKSYSFSAPNKSFAVAEGRVEYSTKSLASEALELFKAKSETKPLGNNAESNFEPDTQKSSFRFLGSALGTFLVAEKNGSLFVIDQHAAHERMLFNKIMAETPNKVPLIIPYVIQTEDENENLYLESIAQELNQAGFEAVKVSENRWEINTTPDRWKGSEGDLREAILSKRLNPNEIIRSIAAMTACKAAAKDGYILDDITASEIAEAALNLPDPHCPHGRPVYTEFSREKLFMLVQRT